MTKLHTVTFIVLVLNALAVYRFAILVTRDKITESFRQSVDRNFESHPLFEYLVFCPWCVSAYAGAFAVVMSWLYWPVWQFVCLGAACSAVAGFLGEHT